MSLTLQDDMNELFLDSGFEEDVVYTPSGGSAKPISAIVYRQGSKQSSPSRRTGSGTGNTLNRMYDIEIDISTDSTEGVSFITIKEDIVKFKAKIGDATDTTFTVVGIVQNDAGAFRLGLKP